ncbi:uncharacterized protein E0L32_009147 [Thyridium curvatum]|uniref:Derlin n=1 Tax=Thyridium curvatum TaxID=1093900 RepID=A0A507AT52_9PEZI|nr:uncharacterized protein E0L32_009147 [Thyridium curvatum]TPX09674.1 hypothetical protein E0L32_009147 [Thyridium curvatum]
MAEIMDGYWQAPPLARTLALGVFVSSVGVYTGLLSGSWFYHHYMLLFTVPPHLWRPVANFLISGPKLGVILDPYFLYSYLSQMEMSNPRFPRREDCVWYLIFVCSLILTIDGVFGLNTGFCLQGLILALAYTGTQDQRGVKVNYFFVTIPAQLIPYTMMLMTILTQGPGAVPIQLAGLFSAHMYDFLSRIWPEFGGGTNWIATPAFITRLAGSTARIQERTFGTAIRPTGSGSGAGSGPLPDSWRTRGKGQRLG